MPKLVECVPNFSEGRRPEVIQQIIDQMCSVPGVTLLDHESDPAHNRCVVTIVGQPADVKEAVLLGVAKATELIDLTSHTGEHPRMGATDVVPFIPISGISMAECVQLAKEVGEEIASRLEIPVYLYEKAASRKERQDLAMVRQGEFEGIRDSIESDPKRKPDFGPSKVHPTAGAIAVGARMFLVAYNVHLGTTDVAKAQKIADAIRFKTGGFRYVKALGFELKDRGCVQVSMNLVNYKRSPVHRVFQVIESEARRHGVMVLDSEVVGLLPNEALVMAAEDTLRLGTTWSPKQIIENKLTEMTAGAEQSVAPFIDSVADRTETPGGGSVAALAGALGAALGSMVCKFTIGKKKFAEARPRLEEALVELERLRPELIALVKEDAAAFDGIMEAMKLPRGDEGETKARGKAINSATEEAIRVPLKVMEKSLEVMERARTVANLGNPNLLSDAGVASLSARTAVVGAGYNVRINLKGLRDGPFAQESRSRASELLGRSKALAEAMEDLLEKQF